MKNNLPKNIRIKILILINIILFVVLLFCFLPKEKKIFFYTSLLNSDIVEDVNEIIISSPNELSQGNFDVESFNKIVLKKNKDDFIFFTSVSQYKIDKKLVDSLFSVLTQKQNFIFETDSIEEFQNYGIDTENEITMKLIDNQQRIIREFAFGKQDIIGAKRFVRLDSRTKVFTMQDNIYPFLTSNRKFWIDLQIYKNKFIKNSIQSIQKNGKHILRNKKNENSFLKLENFLTQFSCIDIFPASVPASIETEFFTFFLGNEENITIEITPMDSGDYILYDSKLKNAFVISTYTKQRLDKEFEINNERNDE